MLGFNRRLPYEKIFLLVILSVVIIGCSNSKYMRQGLTNLQGSDISEAFSYLGYPDNVQKINSEKIYIWQRAFSSSLTLPQTNYNTGYVGTTPVTMSTTSYKTSTSNHHCVLKIITKDEIIKKWEYDGTWAGCGRYARRLKPIALKKEE